MLATKSRCSEYVKRLRCVLFFIDFKLIFFSSYRLHFFFAVSMGRDLLVSGLLK